MGEETSGDGARQGYRQGEELIVERLPLESDEDWPSQSADAWLIPVLEEQLRVEKRTVVKEYVRVRKRREKETQDVGGSMATGDR
jgi:uncharacterized protein (TIGR02271 family)